MALCKALKPFIYSPNGIDPLSASRDQILDVPELIVLGLAEEGYVELVAAAAGTPAAKAILVQTGLPHLVYDPDPADPVETGGTCKPLPELPAEAYLPGATPLPVVLADSPPAGPPETSPAQAEAQDPASASEKPVAPVVEQPPARTEATDNQAAEPGEAGKRTRRTAA